MNTPIQEVPALQPILLRSPADYPDLPAGTPIILDGAGNPDPTINEYLRQASLATKDRILSPHTLKAKTRLCWKVAVARHQLGVPWPPTTREDMLRLGRRITKGLIKADEIGSNAGRDVSWYLELLALAGELGRLPRNLVEALFPYGIGDHRNAQALRLIARRLRPRRPTPITFTPTEEEAIRAIGSVSSVRDRALLESYHLLGLRCSEAGSIQASAICHAAAGCRDDGQPVICIVGKGCKERWVPLPWSLVDLLEAYRTAERKTILERFYRGRQEPTALFLSRRNGDPLTASGFDKIVRKAIGQASTPRITSHTLRRRMALNWVEDNRPECIDDLFDLQRILGHKEVSVLINRYLVPAAESQAHFRSRSGPQPSDATSADRPELLSERD